MNERLKTYKDSLIDEELTQGTIKTYLREAERLESFLEDRGLDLNHVLEDKTPESKKDVRTSILEYVDEIKRDYKNSTASNKIVKINKYLRFLNLDGMTTKNIRVQNNAISESMTQTDFNRIMRQAKEKGTARDQLMLYVFYQSGIRVSELEFFTVESLKQGYMHVFNKGKYRDVPITKSLAKEAREYIKTQGIKSGAILLSREGNPLHRSTVFRRIKYLGGQARIKKTKAHPHSIRHLFAKEWLKHNNNNVLQLADILGHESLETTRRYTSLSVDEARKTIRF